MSLTQVSTWFANARRRLKKENKWSPDGSCDDSENVSDSGISEENQGTTDIRVPQIPSNDESGYSSSDRDSGSPPTHQISSIPPTPTIPAGFNAQFPLHPFFPMTSMTQPTVTVPGTTGLPRFLPTQPAQPVQTAAKPVRKARSIWSIADITQNETSENETESENTGTELNVTE